MKSAVHCSMQTCVAATALCLAACASHYDPPSDVAAVTSRWNASVPREALAVTVNQSGLAAASSSGDVYLALQDDRATWLAVTSVESMGDLVCTELLLSTAGMSFNHAEGLLRDAGSKGTQGGTTSDGNLSFRITRGGGGVSCTVKIDAPPA